MIATLNKPIFSYVTGGVRGVAAYILSMTTVPITDGNASLKIDEL